MNAPNRQAQINKIYKVLKKYYQPLAPPADRPVLEHLLYGSCLENAKHETVDEVFAKLEQNYFDWNEVRVTTVAELGEVLAVLPDAAEAAKRLKRILQSVFETHYSFDLEFLRKQNLGKAVQELEKLNGVTPYALAYVSQNALGGHAIPVNQGVFGVLQVLGVISAAEAAKQRVPGMERAIPKSKGVEFGSLLHQLGVDYVATPHSPRLRAMITEIAPEAKDRLPRRGGRKECESDEDVAADAADSGPRPSSPEPPPPKSKAKVSRETEAAPSPEASGDAEDGEAAKAKVASKRLSRKKPR